MELSYLFVYSLVVLASANLCMGKCVSTIYARYDDLPSQPPAAVPAPIGVYRGLKYNNVNLVTPGVPPVSQLTGVPPSSDPNVASFGAVNNAEPTNVTVKGGNAYKTINPTSIDYGCVVVSTVVNLPATCTLALSGYKGGVRAVRQLLRYQVEPGQVYSLMDTASLESFAGVDTVKLEIADGTAVLAVLDNFEYTGCI